MNADLILQNMLNPPVLFFFLGMLAVFLKSDLSIPQPLPKLSQNTAASVSSPMLWSYSRNNK